MPLALPTFDALYDIGKSEIQSRNALLTDFNHGSNNDAVTGGAAATADEVLRIVISYFAAKYLDTAEGDDLDALIADLYPDMEGRNVATGSVVTLTFTRGESSGVLLIPEDQECKATVNGVTVTFTVDDDAYMAADVQNLDVLATCTVTGATGNVAANVITTIVGGLPDDATATVTNAGRAAGGSAEESDDQLRDRARRYHGTLRRGTVGAIEAGALGVSGVSFATVDEANIAPDEGGYVALYVGDPDANGNDALADAVEDVIDDYRAAGVDVRTFASAREEFPLAMTISVKRGSDRAAIQAAATAAVIAYGDSLAPNRTFYLSGAVEAAHGVSAAVRDVVITVPTVDQVPAESYNAMRVVSSGLTITIAEVA